MDKIIKREIKNKYEPRVHLLMPNYDLGIKYMITVKERQNNVNSEKAESS